jgi:hypothetical protein
MASFLLSTACTPCPFRHGMPARNQRLYFAMFAEQTSQTPLTLLRLLSPAHSLTDALPSYVTSSLQTGRTMLLFHTISARPLNSLVWYVPSLRYTRGLGWRMHCGAEVTESSTNKQHHLSAPLFHSPPSLPLLCPRCKPGASTRRSGQNRERR